MKRVWITLVVASIVALGAPELAQSQSKCTALKYKIAGQNARAKARCKARAVRDGLPVNAACLAKADAKMASRWADAEGRGDCIATGGLTEARDAANAFLDLTMDALEPFPLSALCCATDGSCWHGAELAIESDCVAFGGTPGPPGTVCNAATGSCGPPPSGTGQCCAVPGFDVCQGGPSLDLTGCIAVPFSAICRPDGSCAFQP